MKVSVNGGDEMSAADFIADYGITDREDVKKVYDLKPGQETWIYIRETDDQIEVTRTR